MEKAQQQGVNKLCIAINVLSNSVVETIKVAMAVLCCLKSSGTIDPQLSLYSLKSPSTNLFNHLVFSLPF